MNEKAIALTVFFISVFLLYQIRFILRFRKLRKINRNMNDDGFVLGNYLPSFCDCCNCLSWLLTPCGIISEDADEVYEVLQEKRAQRQSDKFEQENKEQRRIEQEKYLVEIEQERRRRKEKAEKLRANGYTVAEKDRIIVIETASISTVTNLSWISATTKIPIEEVIIIVEDESDFEIKDEKIINKKKIKIVEITCPNCENPFETGSDFCPNCGFNLKN